MSTFYETLVGRDFVSVGGLEYAQDMLTRAMGKERADEIVAKLSAHTGARPFQFLQQVDPKDLVNFIQSEHPQIVALILAYVPTDFASALLQRLPEDTQAEVAVRLAIMERTSPEVLEDIESAMRARLGTAFAPRQELAAAGGIDQVVQLLRKVDLQTEKAILEGLEKTDPETANEIKKRMFVFDNITLLNDRSIQRVLRDVDAKDLGMALKGASDEVRERIISNMSGARGEDARRRHGRAGAGAHAPRGGGAGAHRRRHPPTGRGGGDLRHARRRGRPLGLIGACGDAVALSAHSLA